MVFLLLLLATASCTLNAMDYSQPVEDLKELPEDFSEIEKEARKLEIKHQILLNTYKRRKAELKSKNDEIKRLKRENEQLLLDRHTTTT